MLNGRSSSDIRTWKRSPSCRKGRITWTFLRMLLAGLLIAAGIIRFLYDVPLQISKETTYLTKPLTADGTEVDYLAAMEAELYPRDMRTDDNGLRLLVQAFGPAKTGPGTTPESRRQVCEKLGLDSNEPSTMKYQDPHQYIVDYVEGANENAALVKRLIAQERSEAKVAFRLFASNQTRFPRNGSFQGHEDASTEEENAASWGEYYGREYEDEWYLDVEREFPLSFRRAWQDPDSETFLLNQLEEPWTSAELPMMARWLKENHAALDLLSEAARRPSFCLPLARNGKGESLLNAITYAEAARMRAFVRGLSARAYYRLGQGNIDAAIDDIQTCRRLARFTGRHGSRLASLLAIAYEGMSACIGAAGDLKNTPTKIQLERLINEPADLAPRMAFRDLVHFDRHLMLDLVQAMAHADCSLFHLAPQRAGTPKLPVRFGCDWNIAARRVNAHYHAFFSRSEHLESRSFSPWLLCRGPRSTYVADWLMEYSSLTDSGLKEAHRRMACLRNLRRIVLAMLLYERDHGTLPPAFTIDNRGRPLHSWRALLLPYLGQRDLYDQIRLEEPWDSKHNRQFHEHTLPFYQCPTADLDPGQTTYAVVVGEATPFDGGDVKELEAFGPHSAHMILVVECKAGSCWMNPMFDVPYPVAREGINTETRWWLSSDQPATPTGIGSDHPGGANVGLRSGASIFAHDVMDMFVTWPALLEGRGDFRQ